MEETKKPVGRPKGIPKTGGRPKGVPNKKSEELLDMIMATGCKHPLVGLAEVAKEAHMNGEFVLAKDCYKELSQYVAPKRKAIEHTGTVETNQPLVIVVDSDDQTN